jgi:S-methylmethionine-dependent homocysteine/selenocysteine methylase
MELTILDGGMGTELARRGAPLKGDAWSASAVVETPDIVRALHEAYTDAGARVVTACTFRTTPHGIGEGWKDAARLAVELAREGASGRALVAGSLAPVADCYRPDLSPVCCGGDVAACETEHVALAAILAGSGCDLIVCETVPFIDEGLIALWAALQTGLPAWMSFTPGFRAELMTPEEMGDGAARAIELGADAVLVNCCPAGRAIDYVRAIGRAARDRVPFGVYANAGDGEHTIGPKAYTRLAQAWIDAGATIVGGCCFTSPEHIAALSALRAQPAR